MQSSTIDAAVSAYRLASRRRAARVKQLLAIFTAAGYGVIAAAIFDPIFKSVPFGPLNVVAIVIGLDTLVLTVVFAPDAEPVGVQG